MKTIHFALLISSFAASAPAATFLYTDSTAFFSSSTWIGGAAAGSTVTENFVASGATYNFTGNEQFNSRSYTYGTGSLQNTITYTRTDGADIFVDTTNETGGFLSSDNPGSSKYLYLPANGGGEGITITFAQPVSSFGFRIGDFGDPTGAGGNWSTFIVQSTNAQTGLSNFLAYEPNVNVYLNDGDNNFNVLNLNITYLGTPNYFVAGSSTGTTSMTIGDKRWAFIGWTFDSPITSISLIQNNGNNDNWGVDTVSFTTVPEPTAALLSGLGMLTLLRRRRA